MKGFSTESPLKKAVKDIKSKENVFRSSKVESEQKIEKKKKNNAEVEQADSANNKALLIEIFDNKK